MIAYLDLYDATNDAKYRDAALKIAETYQRLQRPDGLWFLKYDNATGKPATSNKLIPESFLALSHRLQSLGFTQAKLMCERTLAWLMAEVVTPFNWEGQFQDVGPSLHYRNLSHGQAVLIARYLLAHRDDRPEYRGPG